MEIKKEETLSKSRDADWPAVLFFIHIQLLSLYGLWLLFFEAQWMTLGLLVVLTSVGILGMTAGAHRLWAHRQYKASTGLRVALMLAQTMAGKGTIYDWVQTHRFHHAHFATADDPYDYRRGLLHAHVLSRLRKLSPQQEQLKAKVDMSDLLDDPIITVQNKLYWVLYVIIFLLLPLNAPLEYWNESILSTVFIIGFLRYAIILHASWLIESNLCVWGLYPGEKCPPDTIWVFLVDKSFWPHYHYLMPKDYKATEFGSYDAGCTTSFIRVWAALGLATDLQTVETAAVQKALTEAARSKEPVTECLEKEANQQTLPRDHYLKRG